MANISDKLRSESAREEVRPVEMDHLSLSVKKEPSNFIDITQNPSSVIGASSTSSVQKPKQRFSSVATPRVRLKHRGFGWTPRHPEAVNGFGLSLDVEGVAKQEQPTNPATPSALRCMWKLLRTFLRGPESHSKSKMGLAVLVLLMLCEGVLVIWFSYVQRDFTTALSQKDELRFYGGVLQFLGVIAVAMPIIGLAEWLKGSLALEWRRQMTSHLLNGYLIDTQTYYSLRQCKDGIDNPDQRIGQDIAGFASGTVEMLTAVILANITVVAGSTVLISISKILFLCLLVYAVFGTLTMLRLFGVPLMRLQRSILALEATFRFELVRISENAEAIAFYQGSSFEADICQGTFKTLLSTLYSRLAVLVGCETFKKGFTWVTFLLPALIVGPQYLRGDVDFGAITQVSFLFASLLDAGLVLVNMLDAISGLGAQAVRIVEMKEAVARIKESEENTDPTQKVLLEEIHENDASTDDSGEVLTALSEEKQMRLALEAVSLRVPQLWNSSHDAPKLCTDVSFALQDGESLLISGRSGIGKSSLLRAICGLWTSGQGTVRRTTFKETFFLPQKPYMCSGTLRQQVTYPGGFHASDDEIKVSLKDVNLGHLVARHGLDTAVDFGSVLSLGEQQRLAFARLLLRKGVKLALIDEGTSALDAENEAAMYKMLKAKLGCYVSVGHRPQLLQFHSHKLHLESGEDGCKGTLSRLH